MLVLSRIVCTAVRRGRGSGELVTAFIGGHMGSGKTTYAVLVAREVYAALGYEDPWRAAVEHLFMTPAKLREWELRALREYEKRVREGRMDEYRKTPVIVLDDLAGGWIDRYAWRESAVQKFAKIFNMVRSLTGGVLLTSVEREDVIKSVRNKVDFIIHVSPVDAALSRAVGYKRYVDQAGNEKLKLAFVDYFKRGTLPKHVYAMLEEARLAALKETLEEEEEGGEEKEEVEVQEVPPPSRSRAREPEDPVELLKAALARFGIEVDGDVVDAITTAVVEEKLPGAFLTLRTREVALTRETLAALGLDGIISLAELARILSGRYTATKNTNGDYVRVVVLPKRPILALSTTSATTTS
ncbi:MAG: hypothetical protein QXF87_04810 [Thermofilaceae archaeon]